MSTSSTTPYRKKLIEVALPLDAINKESAREKSIRHGHPSTLHLWWARRPLAAARAVLFAQMVDDPSSLPDEFPSEEAQEAERQRLFRIIEELVKWENTTNEAVLHAARVEIARSAARNAGVSLPHSMTPAEVADALKKYAPPVLDPFAGGGSIPLEAQRLGLEAHASDLNPVAVLINKALIEIPPKFAGHPPVNPESRKKYLQREWRGAEGLAEDVRYYGQRMRDEVYSRIGHLYPKAVLPQSHGGGQAMIIAWIWARTVKCPNPACGAETPLVRSFHLSARRGRRTWVKPIIDRTSTPPSITYTIEMGEGRVPEGTIGRQGANCIVCGSPISLEYVRTESQAHRLGVNLMATVAEGKGGRIYLPPTSQDVDTASMMQPSWGSEAKLSTHPQYMAAPRYGMTRHRDLFTPRQLVALTAFGDLIKEVHQDVFTASDGDADYADAVATYLAFILDKAADMNNSLCMWKLDAECPVHLFGRNALPMCWDFVEANILGTATGSWLSMLTNLIRSMSDKCLPARGHSHRVYQHDATDPFEPTTGLIISTDPPYYDNVPYADLSDFFYIWLRRTLSAVYPDLFTTVLVPKTEELVADVVRHGGRDSAQRFFQEGLEKSFSSLLNAQSRDYPLTIYYAFKQSDLENESNGIAAGVRDSSSTGWETMLDGLLRARFSISGTWPVRTELRGGLREYGRNSLASSIVLVCRPRPADAPMTTRRDFLAALHRELPKALRDLQRGYIAPVDLAQAAIGPGMAAFSRYSKVLESDGSPMRVRTALQLINQALDEVLAEQEGEYDAETRWAVAWFEQYGVNEGPYGVAETLSKAKNTAVGALVEAGILEARGGKVRLLGREELAELWNPAMAKRLTVWEVTQRLIRALQEQGEAGAAAILDHVDGMGDVTRDLAYRLYTVSERKKWAEEALAYNSLVVEWTDISGAAERLERTTATQGTLL